MIFSKLSNLSFDQQDANLFLVDDARLRADALMHSVLPRLRTVMNVAVSLIREIYGIELLNDSIISVYPNFRQKRTGDLKIMYQDAFVGLGGQRKAKWPGFSRKDKKPVQILPFRFAFIVDQQGVFTTLENGWLKGLDQKSTEKILRFHIENEQKINALCFESGHRPKIDLSIDATPLNSISDYYQCRIDNSVQESGFIGNNFHFPVGGDQLIALVNNFAYFFPVYDSYINLAKGMPHQFDFLMDQLSNWLRKKPTEVSTPKLDSLAPDVAVASAKKLAGMRVRTMPAIRWQIFERDKWKCVACGRDSHSGAILHVDHIIPRSKGGADVIDNFQTLCDVCNIGKSNRDTTDLRSRS